MVDKASSNKNQVNITLNATSVCKQNNKIEYGVIEQLRKSET